MALVFGIVVAHELLFALAQLGPVAVLNGGCVACALLLLLHFLVKLFLVNGQSVLTADKLGKVEREAVSVEQAERLGAVKLGLALFLNLVHCVVEHVDTVRQRAKERVFLLFYHPHDKLALCR